MALESEKSKIKVPADSVSGEGHFLLDGCLLILTSHGRSGKKALLGLFYKDTNPIYDAFIHMT